MVRGLRLVWVVAQICLAGVFEKAATKARLHKALHAAI